MKLIALVVVLSTLTCLDARAVHENAVVETARCVAWAYPDICPVIAPIARLVVQPLRTFKLIKEAISDILSNFSFKESLEAFLGAVSLPLSVIIHSPEIMKQAIHNILTYTVPYVRTTLWDIGHRWVEQPMQQLTTVVEYAFIFPQYVAIRVTEGILVAMSESGFPINNRILATVVTVVLEVMLKIIRSIDNFQCTDVSSREICDKVYQAFENIVVKPTYAFAGGLISLVENSLKKFEEVAFPILDQLSLSKLYTYCRKVLSDKTCTNILSHIKELDKFNEEEIEKAENLFEHVRQWIAEHIFTDNVQVKLEVRKWLTLSE